METGKANETSDLPLFQTDHPAGESELHHLQIDLAAQEVAPIPVRQEAPRSQVLEVTLAAGIVIGTLIAYFGSHSISVAITAGFGLTLLALVIYMLARAIKPLPGKTRTGPLLGILAVLALIAGATRTVSDPGTHARDMEAIFALQRDLLHATDTMRQKGSLDPVPLDTHSTAEGDTGLADTFIRNSTNQFLAEASQYRLAVSADGMSRLLTPKLLATDHDLRQNMSMLTAIRKDLERHQQHEAQLSSALETDARQIPFSDDNFRQNFLTSMTTSLNHTKSQIAQGDQLDNAIVENYGRVMDLLSTNRQRWSVGHDHLLFTDAGTLARFQSLMIQLRNSGEAEQAFASQVRQDIELQLQQMAPGSAH